MLGRQSSYFFSSCKIPTHEGEFYTYFDYVLDNVPEVGSQKQTRPRNFDAA